MMFILANLPSTSLKQKAFSRSFTFKHKKQFFLKHVPYNFGNLEYWTKKIFQSCHDCKNFLTFCNNVFSLFPRDQGDPEKARELLNNHAECMRDAVSLQAASKRHKEEYGKLIDSQIMQIQRGNPNVSPSRNLLLARARACDSAAQYLKGDEKQSFTSCT